MSRLEFLERLSAKPGEERWLVRAGDDPDLQVAWIFHDDDGDYLAALERDTRPWLEFAHPRVAPIRGIACLDGRIVIATADDRGPTLPVASQQLADAPEDRERWTVAQLIAIADGLAAMGRYAPGFVHRQLEPRQMFVDASGHCRLRAPVAQVTAGRERNYVGQGRVKSSIRWMSPEQLRGQAPTPASDVFALAGILVTALSGKPVFVGSTDFELLQAIMEAPPVPTPTIAPGLDQVIALALAKSPTDRIASPAALAAALRACVADSDDYDACLSDRIAAWWPAAPQVADANATSVRCQQRWEDLASGDSPDIRHCGSCQQHVVRVTSLAAAVPLVGKHCLAYRAP